MIPVAKIKEQIIKRKYLLIPLVVLAAGLLVAGGWFGWKQYTFWQSGQYAFEKIKAALAPPDPASLAKQVDFYSVSGDIAKSIADNFPFFMPGADQERNISHHIQTALLKKFMDKDEKKQQTLEKEDEIALLHKNLEILPRNFVEQLFNTLNYKANDDNSGFVTAKVENELLNKNFTMIFNLDRTPNGWKITHLSNARELASQMREAMLQRHAKLRSVYEDKNAKTWKTMNQLIPIQSCTANAGLLSDGKTLLMVVHVIARNRGTLQINNFNVDTTIYGKNGKVLMRRFLNTAKPVTPGEDFDHRWNFELDAQNPQARLLLTQEPLQCKAIWQTLSLNNGQVLQIQEVPNPDLACEIDGHNHPQGFCQTPVFLY